MRLALLLVCVVSTPSTASAETPETPEEYFELPELEPPRPVRDRFSLRVGFLHSGLFDSNQGRPFFYFDFGLRFKTDRHYIDVKVPAFVAGLDYLSFQLQTLIGINTPFNFFEAANEPIQYAAFIEPVNVRLGQTYTARLGDRGAPLRLTAGIFTLFDFVFFNLALVNRDPDEFRDIYDPTASDPFVLAPGGFISIGGDAPLSEWDLAIGVGPDIYQDDAFLPENGAVIFADLEFEIDPLDVAGAYMRTRLSTYTHTEATLWTLIVSYGVALPLL